MNKIWNELLEFETRDLVDRFIQKRYSREINANRVQQITSNFIQAREYFRSAEDSNFTVRPLLQYYGVMALSKGLILSLNLSQTEHQLKSSHGLEIKNWKEVLKNKDFENLRISVGEGTFSELITTTENKNYLSANSSAINWASILKMPQNGEEFTLRQVIQYFPDLHKEYDSWLSEKLIFAVIQELKSQTDDGLTHVKFQGLVKDSDIELLFPREYCPDKTIIHKNHSTIIKYSNENWSPNITQRWHGAFNIGDGCVIPTLPNDIGLNLLSGMYIVSYVFGMMARYFPTSWIGIKRVEKGDKIYPFAIRILEFIHEKYPKQVLDFLNSPYDFENE
ncbi:YaaC family protein [Flavobacteriaceae bacterium]|nr:YaaC family protein [Flavobacteriaceae bacterium]